MQKKNAVRTIMHLSKNAVGTIMHLIYGIKKTVICVILFSNFSLF